MEIKRRISRYSSGMLFTEYLKICKYCKEECWVNKKNIEHCSRNCANNHLRKIINPLEFYFREKISRLRSNAKTRRKEFNLTWNDLLERYNKQNGLCYYTNIKMSLTYSVKSEKICPPKQLSVDRLDNKKGYDKDNIVLCLFCINNFKGEMSINEFKEIINEIRFNED
jgi:hypothetical protein